MGHAEDGPRIDAIALDDRRVLGRTAPHVEADAAGHARILPAKPKALDVENDLEAVPGGAAVRDGDSAQPDRRLGLLVGRRPSTERARVVAGGFGRRGASGHGKGRRGQRGRRGDTPGRESEEQEERGERGEDPGRGDRDGGPGLRAHRYRDGEQQQRARFGHPRRIGRRPHGGRTLPVAPRTVTNGSATPTVLYAEDAENEPSGPRVARRSRGGTCPGRGRMPAPHRGGSLPRRTP